MLRFSFLWPRPIPPLCGAEANLRLIGGCKFQRQRVRKEAGMRSKDWSEALLIEQRSHLRTAAVRAAFDQMVQTAELLRDYDCDPAFQGAVRIFKYVDRATGARPFVFTVNRKDLLFYVRQSGRQRIRGGRNDLQRNFASFSENRRGEWTVRIADAAQAVALSGFLFGAESVGAIRFGKSDRERADESEEEAIRQRTDIGPTVKKTLVDARRGQGVYRENLQGLEQQCRVTGLLDRRHLRASHIKPWCVCDDAEKLDGFNGLLLSPHIDHLFGRGYLSFSNEGDLMIAKELNPVVLERWGIRVPRNVGTFRPEQHRYLEYHRANVFEKTSGGRRGQTDDALELLETGEPVIVNPE